MSEIAAVVRCLAVTGLVAWAWVLLVTEVVR